MALFRYKAVAGSGDTIEGEMEAPSQSVVVQRLQAQGHLPIRAEAVTSGAGTAAVSLLRRDILGSGGPARRDVAHVTRELSTLLGAGLSLERSLEILEELSERVAVRQLLAALLEGIRGGKSFADALEEHDRVFPRYYVSMVRAGEAGGTLEIVLARLSDFMERTQATRESVRSALIYPAILVVMALVAIVVLLSVVVPRFRPMFEDAGAALPVSTQIVMLIGDAVENYWWMALLAVVVAALLGRRLLRQKKWRLRWDRWLATTPLLGGLLIRADIARLSRTLGTLVDNGVSLLAALALARGAVGNSALAADIEGAEQSLREGKTLAEPFTASVVVPRLAAHLTRVGEETGRLGEMFLKIAEIYDDEVRRAIERMLAMLVPVLTIVLGLIIAGIIGSILAAILSVYNLPM